MAVGQNESTDKNHSFWSFFLVPKRSVLEKPVFDQPNEPNLWPPKTAFLHDPSRESSECEFKRALQTKKRNTRNIIGAGEEKAWLSRTFVTSLFGFKPFKIRSFAIKTRVFYRF